MQLNKVIGHFQHLSASVSATTTNAQVSSVPAHSCSLSFLHISSLASFSSDSSMCLLIKWQEMSKKDELTLVILKINK